MFRFVVIVMLVTTAALAGCGSDSASTSRTTDTSSTEFDSPQTRLEFASRYLTAHGPAIDVAFDIRFQDNSSGFPPGPSDWDMTAAYQVDPTTIDQWEGTGSEPVELSWASGFTSAQNLTSPPEFFVRDGTTIVIYRQDGVVLAHSTTGSPLAPPDS